MNRSIKGSWTISVVCTRSGPCFIYFLDVVFEFLFQLFSFSLLYCRDVPVHRRSFQVYEKTLFRNLNEGSQQWRGVTYLILVFVLLFRVSNPRFDVPTLGNTFVTMILKLHCFSRRIYYLDSSQQDCSKVQYCYDDLVSGMKLNVLTSCRQEFKPMWNPNVHHTFYFDYGVSKNKRKFTLDQ